MVDKRLLRLFVLRFLDHDLVSPHADRREVLSLSIGAVFSLNLFFAVLIAVKYQFNMFMPPGMTALLSLDDRVLLVSATMLIMGLVAVVHWDALVLDARDTAVLGHLPVSRTAIVRAKFAAVALFGAAFALACSAAPTVLRGVALPP